VQIATNGGFAVALRSDGNAVAWGDNSQGQCYVPPLPPGVLYVAVAAGVEHAVARRSDGNVVAWGAGFFGQTAVPALPPGVEYVGVAACEWHTAALRSDGRIAAFGHNYYGQCNVPPLPNGVAYVHVTAGGFHTAGLRSDGHLVVWGDNGSSQCTVLAPPAGQYYGEAAGGGFHTAGLVQSGFLAKFGSGCPGSLPPSRLHATSLPRIGATMAVEIDRLPQSSAFVAMGFSNLSCSAGPLPLSLTSRGMPDCWLRVGDDNSLWVTGASGRATHSLPIPSSMGLVGLPFYLQALVLDAAAGNPAGAVMSDAVTGLVGS